MREVGGGYEGGDKPMPPKRIKEFVKGLGLFGRKQEQIDQTPAAGTKEVSSGMHDVSVGGGGTIDFGSDGNVDYSDSEKENYGQETESDSRLPNFKIVGSKNVFIDDSEEAIRAFRKEYGIDLKDDDKGDSQ